MRKKQFFLFRSCMHLPAEIRYLLRYGRNDRLWAGIFSGTKQPCFYTSQGTGKVNTNRTDRYGTKLTFLIIICFVFCNISNYDLLFLCLNLKSNFVEERYLLFYLFIKMYQFFKKELFLTRQLKKVLN